MLIRHRHQLRHQDPIQPTRPPPAPHRARAKPQSRFRALRNMEDQPPCPTPGDPQARASYPRRPPNPAYCALHLPPVPRGDFHDPFPMDGPKHPRVRRSRLGGVSKAEYRAVRALRASGAGDGESNSRLEPSRPVNLPAPLSFPFVPFPHKPPEKSTWIINVNVKTGKSPSY